LLGVTEVADELAVDVQTVRRWIHAGELRAFKPGKEFRIRHSDLEEFLRAREVRPKDRAASPSEAPPSTPRTDEPEPDFERRFEALSSAAQANVLRLELDEEWLALKGLGRRLVTEAPAGEARGSLALRQANAKLQRCAVRLQAVTLLLTDLRFADVGHKRQTFEEYAGTFGEYARFWSEVEEQDRRAASGEASGASA
jgi:excisionase family DNA binding protein